jgi:hypothetical protein
MAAAATILVTGTNGGLGSAIVEQIASKPEFSAYHGLYTVRDTSKAGALDAVLKNGASHSYDVVALDLTKLDNVRLVAERINVCFFQSFTICQRPPNPAIFPARVMLIMPTQGPCFLWRNSTTPRCYLERRLSGFWHAVLDRRRTRYYVCCKLSRSLASYSSSPSESRQRDGTYCGDWKSRPRVSTQLCYKRPTSLAQDIRLGWLTLTDNEPAQPRRPTKRPQQSF